MSCRHTFSKPGLRKDVITIYCHLGTKPGKTLLYLSSFTFHPSHVFHVDSVFISEGFVCFQLKCSLFLSQRSQEEIFVKGTTRLYAAIWVKGLHRVFFFFSFKPGCCCGPRAKLLDNSLIVSPPRSNHMQSFPPSMLRRVYKHLVLLEVRPVSVRQSCPAASQPLSLHWCLLMGCDQSSQPAALPQTSLVHHVDIFHSKACSPNVLSIFLTWLETLSSFRCSLEC